MASVDWGCKSHGGGEAKAIFRHNEKEQRKKHEHSNEHIDKSLTDNNISFLGLSYKEMCDKYDKRVRELESNTPKLRKDRVTHIGLEIPIPDEVPDELKPQWANDMFNATCEFVGEENVIDGNAHFDEKHVYIDPKTKLERESLHHLHIDCVPGVEGRLNCKAFSSRARIIELNNKIQTLSMEKYGIAFNTGEGTKSKDNVETLKNKSKQAEIELMHQKLDARNKRLGERENAVDDREYEVSKKEKEVEERTEKVSEREKRLDTEANRLDALQNALNERERALRRREQELLTESEKQAKIANFELRLQALEETAERIKSEKLKKAVEQGKAINKAFADGNGVSRKDSDNSLNYS